MLLRRKRHEDMYLNGIKNTVKHGYTVVISVFYCITFILNITYLKSDYLFTIQSVINEHNNKLNLKKKYIQIFAGIL